VRLSFTGTHRGMTQAQVLSLADFIARASVLVHGACVGADDEADILAVFFRVPRRAFPSTSASMRITNDVLESRIGSRVFIYPAAPPLVRNRDIVRQSDHLVACPAQPIEVLRSGTWATVREARRIGIPVTVITPAGDLT